MKKSSELFGIFGFDLCGKVWCFEIVTSMDCILIYDNDFEINYVSFRAEFWIVCSSFCELLYGGIFLQLNLVHLWLGCGLN